MHQLSDLDLGVLSALPAPMCPLFCSITHSFCKIILYTGENQTQSWEIFIWSGLIIVLIDGSMGVCMRPERVRGRDGC